MARGQAIRPSQFALTYGVGSILEGPNGPRIILDFKDWGPIFSYPHSSARLSDFEIRDRNASALLGGGRIFVLPTNADMQIPDERVLFRTDHFPRWALCQDHHILYRMTKNGKSRCPHCSPNKNAQPEAIRFVRACPAGHLDDVNWKGIVHRKSSAPCDGESFDWIERGSTLRDITIKCRDCGAKVNLQEVYYGTWKCTGRFPESGVWEHCDEKASVILRNASNLRIAEVISVLTIPPRVTPLHRLLENRQILTILASESFWTKEKLLKRLKTAARTIPGLLSPIAISKIEKAPEDHLISTIKEVRKPPKKGLTEKDVRDQEFQALKNAAANGAPPRPYPEPTDFEVDKNAVTVVSLSPKLTLRVTPVKRLRVILAQKGYRRPIRGPDCDLVKTFYTDNQDRWYVGVELRGEGIFLDLPSETALNLVESGTKKAWMDEFDRTGFYGFHPVHVWWHTLSHRLIKALSVDSGYSSASIRERIYVKTDSEKVRTSGGFLLYTSQRGGDGTLGGLIALVQDFDRVMSAAVRDINTCSNDPLCSEHEFIRGRINGAACYACLFLSETSCEYGNSYLDRNLLRQNIL